MKKRNKTVTAYHVIGLIGFILVILSLIFGKENLYDKSVEAESYEIKPVSIEQKTDWIREYTLSMRETSKDQSCLFFYTNHKFVHVYADGNLIYALETTHSPFGNTTGSVCNFVEIPASADQVVVTIEAAYRSGQNYSVDFEMCNALEKFRSMQRRSVPGVLISVMNIFLGLCMVIYRFFVRKKVYVGRELLYLGILCVDMGFWTFMESDMINLMVPNHVAISFIAFVCLMLLGMPFVLFVKYFFHAQDRILYRVLLILQECSAVILLVLHFTGIAQLKETASVTHLMIFLSILYFFFILLGKMRDKDVQQRIKVSLIGFLIMFISMLVDLFTYYNGARQGDVIGKIGFLIYVIMLGYITLKGTIARMQEGSRAEFYHELAERDMFTDTYNRNAYESDVAAYGKKRDTLVITFDLNNLKFHNDHFGHKFGDKYIKDAAVIIKKVFQKYGKIYRIGGDEFCILIDSRVWCPVDRLLLDMQDMQDAYNEKTQVVHMQIAYGYAWFDENQDQDLEHTRNRADKRMYENKDKQKANDSWIKTRRV